MTIIAYDGKNVCVDEQFNSNDIASSGVKFQITKKGELLLFTGSVDLGTAKMVWYEKGAKAKSFPKANDRADDADVADLIVFHRTGGPTVYYQQPIPVPEPGAPAAWGAGAPVAMGVMLSGKTAMEAIEIAFAVNTSCGIGYATFNRSPDGIWEMVSRKKCKMVFDDVKIKKPRRRK
jgi:hypothetical protein